MIKYKYRIMHDGLKYKIQRYSGWWIFKQWGDLGRRLPPFTIGSWKCTYYDTKEEAQAFIDEVEKINATIHEWKEI